VCCEHTCSNLDMFLVLGLSLACIDMLIHAPGSISLKRVVMTITLVSLYFDELTEYDTYKVATVLSLVGWVALIVTSETAETKEVKQTSIERNVQKMHPKGLDKLNRGLEEFLKNLGDTNADGQPWKLIEDCPKSKIKIYNSPFDQNPELDRWKLVMEIDGVSMETLEHELFNVENYFNADWNESIKEGKVLQRFDDVDHDYKVTQAVTHQLAGGWVKSREFVDIRMVQKSGPHVPEGGCIATGLSVHHEDDGDWLQDVPPEKKKIIRGKTFPGGGVIVKPVGANKFILTSVGCIDLKINLPGWVPKSMVESTTVSAMKESNKKMITWLKSVESKKK